MADCAKITMYLRQYNTLNYVQTQKRCKDFVEIRDLIFD